MAKEKATKEGILKAPSNGKFLETRWKYSLIISLTVIGGYLVLVGVLLIPIVWPKMHGQKINEFGELDKALDAIKTITAVFGHWIA